VHFLVKALSRKGFTLLEVMIAVAILSIALVTAFQSQSQSISLETESRFLTTASLLAQGKMADVEKTDSNQVFSSSGDFGNDFPDYSWRIEITDTAFQYLKKIDLIVMNSRMVSKNAYQLEYYRFIRK
jgi:type II secretion system protein I